MNPEIPVIKMCFFGIALKGFFRNSLSKTGIFPAPFLLFIQIFVMEGGDFLNSLQINIWESPLLILEKTTYVRTVYRPVKLSFKRDQPEVLACEFQNILE